MRIPFPAQRQNGEMTMKEKLALPISQIGLKLRTANVLEDADITTVEMLLNQRPGDLLVLPNFGEKTLEEVYVALAELGFARKAA